MATVTLKGNPYNTAGNLPAKGSTAPDFKLTASDLSDKSLADFAGKKLVLNIFPSLDTSTCAQSVRRFNERAASRGKDVAILCISRDLPFAHSRFCAAEGIEGVICLSSMKDNRFGKDYGVSFVDGPLEGLFSRGVVVTDSLGKVLYTEQVSETANEPDYDSALAALD